MLPCSTRSFTEQPLAFQGPPNTSRPFTLRACSAESMTARIPGTCSTDGQASADSYEVHCIKSVHSACSVPSSPRVSDESRTAKDMVVAYARTPSKGLELEIELPECDPDGLWCAD
jgi:hypothetical protein